MARLRPLLSETEIAARVEALARRISADYRQAGELMLVGVLKGSFIFLADLSRKLTIPRRVDFVALSTYPGESTQPGAVRTVMDLRQDIAGRHVLVVEDIVDTGHTLRYLLRLLEARGPASLRTCVLVRKRRQGPATEEVPVDYLGFEIPDRWVVGYGLDWSERYRTLPYIALLEEA
ncbi:MAG: hypoxanthine phosphoribosyltransferase [Deferrisomatales bacterium]